MNKPVRKEYHGRSGKIYFTEKYIKELEEYSKSLEQRCLSDEWNLSCLDKDYKKLEKTLDQACEQLELMSEAHYISREEWKEWLMKDE